MWLFLENKQGAQKWVSAVFSRSLRVRVRVRVRVGYQPLLQQETDVGRKVNDKEEALSVFDLKRQRRGKVEPGEHWRCGRGIA